MSTDAKIIIGRIIRQLRESNGLSQEKLAERARITYQYLSAIENGKENFTIGILEAIARALDIEVPMLIEQAYADPTPVPAVNQKFFIKDTPLDTVKSFLQISSKALFSMVFMVSN